MLDTKVKVVIISPSMLELCSGRQAVLVTKTVKTTPDC
jgi:hypothetical protein